MRYRDLSARTKLRVTGSDRLRFINGQTSNDARKATADRAQQTCMLDAKGHLQAFAFLFATDDTIWIDTDEDVPLAPRLERYIIADDVQVEDVSAQFALLHVLDERRPNFPDATFVQSNERVGQRGWDLWVEAKKLPRLEQELTTTGQELSQADWELLRIENGVPAWGRELTTNILPPEAGLDKNAIDYEKGCYIGQETISRLKMSGQLRQQLRGVVSSSELSASAALHLGDKIAGQITSAIFSPRLDEWIGLALIKRSYTEPGTELIGPNHTMVRVTSLPFVTSNRALSSVDVPR